ncbi:TPA: EexN family lipoprotein [Yersinia enterocolitica]|jgi:hypothetical protein|uniref:EexN family lipoprotein n=1 Tax=Yersiniaceae TaxID=1903411 RepID=UPI0008FE9858|nr:MULTISPECIES: EexN family lipoprotein [Yersinia]HBE9155787.1 EexN family lipoprotein [Serratia fonticola]HDL6644959.1 EexN family lipoprotein [Yersinia enterocolitica]OJB81115.1 hypothetical protein A9Q62_16700 [Yersinia ruckeri]HDL8245916.1 EexN family lipoprotein [Yersinia enterocolitica]HDV7149321.1 EexN family lipoprotein [Yersinia enterocolitica]
MKKIIVVVSALLIGTITTGCQDKTSVEWYMSHHEDMFAKYTECLVNHNFIPTDCQNSRSAMDREHDKPDVIEGLKAARKKAIQVNIGGE